MRISTAQIALLFLCAIMGQTPAQFQLEQAFPNLTFTQPVDLQNAGDGSDRLFVVERRGVISVFRNDAGVTGKTTFLDIQDRVDDSFDEEGLLGLAFHPDYANNGYFYVNYTADSPNRTVISRFKVSPADSNVALADSEFVVITLPKPFSNHNAGAIAFGPNDGYLYITAGDGGSGGDPQGNGQNRQTLLGNILRIDVDQRDPGLNYAIPPSNPFVGNGQGYREEIYAYGFRNPWRMSFDPVTGWLWVGDVGQDSWEEVDVVNSGLNYGWNVMEGAHCFSPPSGCNTSGKELPVWEYSHSLGIAITGGYVYRGPGVPSLQGKYIYSDFGSGRVWALEYDGGITPPVNTLLLDSPYQIASFGVDEENELYLCAFNSRIYRFTPTPTGIDDQPAALPRAFELGQNFPNPFNPSTIINYQLPTANWVTLKVYDALGREIATLVNGRLAAGSHSVQWDGSDAAGQPVASGVYFYRLTVLPPLSPRMRGDERGVSQTRKMLLLR